MNKKLIAIIACSVIAIAIIIVVIVFNSNNHKAVVDFDTKLSDKINYYKKFGKTYGNEGVVTVEANYRGAHGESMPHEFTYNFYYENGKVYFGNDEGYSSMDNILIDVFNYLSTLDITFKQNNNEYKFDASKIGEFFNKDVNDGVVEVATKGLSKDINNIYIYLLDNGKNDDSTITYDKDLKTGSGKLFGKPITIAENAKGLSLQYDNKIKINMFIKDDHIEYNIVNDGYTYKMYLYDNKIDISANGDSAVYRGLDMHFEFKDIDFNKNNELDKKDICITRYFNALGKVGSEY